MVEAGRYMEIFENHMIEGRAELKLGPNDSLVSLMR